MLGDLSVIISKLKDDVRPASTAEKTCPAMVLTARPFFRAAIHAAVQGHKAELGRKSR